MIPSNFEACRVCRHPTVHPFMTIDRQNYLRCPFCEATFLAQDQLPTPALETERYRLHRNVVADPAYRRFLSRLADPLLSRLTVPSRGLDYGCGPGPALVAMLNEAGHTVSGFDPLFFPDHDLLSQTYDFITCTETAEHFHHPAEELAKLDRLLRPGGLMGVMTCFQTDDSRFADWSYRRDVTHVVFYRERTFRMLAGQFDWLCTIPAKDVVIMQKKPALPADPTLV